MELRTARSRSRASSTDSQRPINVRRDRVPRRRLDAMENVAFNYDCDADYSEYGSIGLMNNICRHCNAKKFKGETPGMCCLSGKVVLPALEPPPEPLDSLLNGQSPRSKHFLKTISSYNACFQMTSFGATKVIRDAMTFKVISSQGISNVLYNATKDKIFNIFRNSDPNSPYIAYTLQIQGQLYHRAGSLLPFADGDHQFLQIYFIDNETTELDQRCTIGSNTRRDIVLELQRFLHQNNELVKLFKVGLDRMPSDNHKIVIRADKTPVGQRHMHEYAQDAMSYVRHYGRPDLFITFTCNPKWADIKDNLFEGQTSADRHDITARVFREKLKKLMDLIVKLRVFGEVRCYMYSIEWQKRGLPHAHILIWFKTKWSKPT